MTDMTTQNPATWRFSREGKEEDVALEAWAWAAGYRGEDGEVRQFGLDGVFHQFAELDQDRVESLTMYDTANPERRYDLYVRPGMQLFHFYRNFRFQVDTPDAWGAKAYVFGWKDRESGLACYHYILPDGNLVTGAGEDLMAVGSILQVTRVRREEEAKAARAAHERAVGDLAAGK